MIRFFVGFITMGSKSLHYKDERFKTEETFGRLSKAIRKLRNLGWCFVITRAEDKHLGEIFSYKNSDIAENCELNAL